MEGDAKRRCLDSSNAGSDAHQSELEKSDVPFTEAGKFEDEVQLEFDDKKELFVPKVLLVLASPVFEAMFTNDFVEKRTKCVPLPGKNYDDFLEFLLSIHPAYLKEINDSNVLRIVPIAEEYQVTSIVTRCKTTMKDLVRRQLKEVEACSMIANRYNFNSENAKLHFGALKNCLQVLQVATSLCFEDVADTCIKAAGRYSSGLYGNIKSRFTMPSSLSELHNECTAMFENLPESTKYKLISTRLSHCDNFNLAEDTL